MSSSVRARLARARVLAMSAETSLAAKTFVDLVKVGLPKLGARQEGAFPEERVPKGLRGVRNSSDFVCRTTIQLRLKFGMWLGEERFSAHKYIAKASNHQIHNPLILRQKKRLQIVNFVYGRKISES